MQPFQLLLHKGSWGKGKRQKAMSKGKRAKGRRQKTKTRNTYPKAAAPVTCMVICPSCVKMFTSLPDLATALRLVISSSIALLMVPAYAERFSEWNMG